MWPDSGLDRVVAELDAADQESRLGFTARDHYIWAAGRPHGPDVMVSRAAKATFRTQKPSDEGQLGPKARSTALM